MGWGRGCGTHDAVSVESDANVARHDPLTQAVAQARVGFARAAVHGAPERAADRVVRVKQFGGGRLEAEVGGEHHAPGLRALQRGVDHDVRLVRIQVDPKSVRREGRPDAVRALRGQAGLVLRRRGRATGAAGVTVIGREGRREDGMHDPARAARQRLGVASRREGLGTPRLQ